MEDELITHDDAQKAAQRLINAAFRNAGEKPRFHIPARPDDDDLLITAYIRQQEAHDKIAAGERSSLQEAVEARARLDDSHPHANVVGGAQ